MYELGKTLIPPLGETGLGENTKGPILSVTKETFSSKTDKGDW
jgi:hypothetical protein